MDLGLKLSSYLDSISSVARSGHTLLDSSSAAKLLLNQGLPSRKWEDWKYQPLSFLQEKEFSVAEGQIESQGLIKSNASLEIWDSLKEKPSSDWKLWLSSWKNQVNYTETLACALSRREIGIKIKNNGRQDNQIEISLDGREHQGLGAVHIWLDVEPGASAQLIFRLSPTKTATNSIFVLATKVRIGKEASLQIVNLQNTGFSEVGIWQNQIQLMEKASLDYFNFDFGSWMGRHECFVAFEETGGNARVLGACISHDQQAFNQSSLIEHKVGNCTSDQLFKTVIGQNARGSFDGKVKIFKGANGAQSAQLNSNLLLADLGDVNSKPQLEVSADDVKATHGSTVGSFNADEIFYLKSRGISQEKAEDLLATGYLLEVAHEIPQAELRAEIANCLALAMDKARSKK